jgi:hypothetical protein
LTNKKENFKSIETMKNLYIFISLSVCVFAINRAESQCTNVSAYGLATAPAGGTTVSITTCQFAGEYATLNSVAAATNYESATDLAGGYFTIHQGTSGGPVVGMGTTPLNWTSTVSGTYYVHLNTSSGCGSDISCHTSEVTHIIGGCTNATAFGSVTAPNSGNTTQITTCQFAGQYATVTGCAAAATYISTSSVSTDFITIHQGTPAGPVILAGTTPLSWTATSAGNYYVHYNTNSSCGTQNVCRTTDITHVNVICTNTTSYGSATAPVNALVNITTCQFAGEYATISSCIAGNSYTSYTDLIGAYFTIHQGTFNGPVVAAGTAPLNWTASVGGTYYVHLNSTSSCTSDLTCHRHDIENVCLAPPSAVTSLPTNICPGLTSNLNATSTGNTINWFTTATGGTSIGASGSGVNFAVNPSANTTYYAEADNGSCSSNRTAVSVSVDPGPTVPSPVTASPSTICIGDPSNLMASSDGLITINNFTGIYAPSNWTTTHNPFTDQGTVNTGGAPSTVSITSSDGGSFGIHSVLWTVTVPANGDITFDWNYATTDVNGSGFDYPQYAINGTIIGNISGFVSGGPNSQSGSCTIAVSAGQTFSLVMTASDDILGAATTVFSNFTGPDLFPATLHWYTVPSGGSSIGTSASGANYGVSPGSTITYYVEGWANGCVSPRIPVTVTVATPSTAPAMTPMPGTYCPNSNLTLTASGGTAGTGSSIEWYTGANGTGSWLGSGSSLGITPVTSGQTYYIRREGACNTTADDQVTINLKNYIYGLNAVTSTTYCTDNSNWHHFYDGNEIILSIRGDISGAAPDFPEITIWENGSWHQTSQGPFTATQCASGLTPGEERFEMKRSWNVDFGGGTMNPPYDVRFYYRPSEKAAIETAANNWMSTYGSCSYTYKYANPNGFYWFKNAGTNYAAPQWDGTHYAGPGGMAGGTTNYVELTGVTSFSGGSGAVILIPDPLLAAEWLYFDGVTDGKTNFLRWATESEKGTSHFNIQRSPDGIDFTTIGTESAQGLSTTTNHYNYDDLSPVSGSNYYRLELENTDGSFSYSETIMLTIADDGKDYSFYPNPTEEVVNYQFESSGRELIAIEVIDVYGRTLARTETRSSVGINKIPVDLKEFPVGSYLIKVSNKNSGQVHLTKVIRSK